MKKLTASIVAGALMISAMGINAFAANGTPEIKVYGNENSPVTAGDKASFIVRLSDFKAVKGMDLTINANGMVDFTNAEISMDKVILEKGENYKVENGTIHIVDLTSADMQKDGYANITIGNATGFRMKLKRPSFTFRKAVNRMLKGRLLQYKRRPFVTPWVSVRYALWHNSAYCLCIPMSGIVGPAVVAGVRPCVRMVRTVVARRLVAVVFLVVWTSRTIPVDYARTECQRHA